MAPDGLSGQNPRRGWLATELSARVASAAVLAAVALAATYSGGWLFALLWLVAGIAVGAEWIAMARLEPRWRLHAVLGAGLFILAVARLTAFSFGGALAVVGVATALTLLFGSTMRDRLWGVAAFLGAAILVLVPPEVRDHTALGIFGVLWMFAVVWTTDIAAYFTGRHFGGPKLWPRVSPKKTWSGFVGGLGGGILAGVAVAWAAMRWGWTSPFGLAAIGLISALASIVSQGGDLAESALKRHFDVKDSGRLIPGHGGVMDRLDGFWAVAVLVGLILLIVQSASPDIFPG